jgi:hypothetical protein
MFNIAQSGGIYKGFCKDFSLFLGQNAENGKNAAFFREFLPFLGLD